MTRRTRLFLLVSGGILVLGLTTAGVASYFGQGLLPGGSDGPPELVYIPDDSRVLAYANVRQLMDSELRRTLLEINPETGEPRDNDFESHTGINIETDVDQVLASFAGSGEEQRPLVLARGRFDEARIEALVVQRNGQIEQYGAHRVFVVTGDDEVMALAFVEPGLAAFGTAAAVRRAIDTAAGASNNVTSNEELMALVRDIDDGSAWAVGRFDALAGARLPEVVTSQLPPITWFSATGHVNGGVQGLIRAEASTEQGAQDLRQVLQGFMALGRMQSGNSVELSTVMNSLQLGGAGRTVSLGFTVPADLIRTFATMQRDRPRGGDADPAPEALPAPAPSAPAGF